MYIHLNVGKQMTGVNFLLLYTVIYCYCYILLYYT